MLTTLIFLIVLAVLIFVHELGHFLIAKWNGIRVDEFKIGFGPKLLAWGKGETKYGLNLIPFGGFVKIHGENPDDDSISGPDKKRSFVHKKGWQKILVLAAGVSFNFIFAWLIYVIVFSSGVTASTTLFDKYQTSFKNTRIIVSGISAKSPAETAGLKVGDILTGLNQQETISVTDIQNSAQTSEGRTLTLKYLREDKSGSVEITPVQGIIEGRYALGISMDNVGDLRLPFFSAIYEGGRYTLIMIRETTVGLLHFFGQIFQGQANFAEVSGPIGIAGIVGSAAQMGFTYLLMITALISINLGVINFIPFPALDGGRILFVLIEGIIRRPIAPKYANTVNATGFVLLMILMVIVTYKDIVKLIW
ncbi:MAG: site-2 protease family protein [Candidatus Paceibacterota bacterium]